MPCDELKNCFQVNYFYLFNFCYCDVFFIVAMAAGCGKIVTCSAGKNIKLWSLPSIENILTGDRRY